MTQTRKTLIFDLHYLPYRRSNTQANVYAVRFGAFRMNCGIALAFVFCSNA